MGCLSRRWKLPRSVWCKSKTSVPGWSSLNKIVATKEELKNSRLPEIPQFLSSFFDIIFLLAALVSCKNARVTNVSYLRGVAFDSPKGSSRWSGIGRIGSTL